MAASRSELDRHVRAAERAQAAALPRWRDVLDRVFGGEEVLDAPAKARLLGVPDRRGFLRIGGFTVTGAVLLAACGDDDTDDALPLPPSTTAAPGMTPGPESDVVLANTAISLEILAVDTYRVALESGLVESAAVAEAVRLFQAHHAEHGAALAAVVQAAGADPYTTGNAAVKAGFVDPALNAAASEADFIRLAYDLEQAAAQTYVHAATVLSTPELRQAAVSIGSIEQRHATVLELAGDLSNDKPAFAPATNPLPSDAMITG